MTFKDINFTNCGHYVANCSGEIYQPNPLQVIVQVDPMIMNISTTDKFDQSMVLWESERKCIIDPIDSHCNGKIDFGVLIYLYEDSSTTLSFEVGAGYYKDDEYARFNVIGEEPFTGIFSWGVVETGKVLRDVAYPGYPNGTIIDIELSASAAAKNAPNVCQTQFEASLYMKNFLKFSEYLSTIYVTFKYSAQNVSFQSMFSIFCFQLIIMI